MVTGRDVRPLVAIPSELDPALERLYGAGRTAVGQIVGDVEQRDELAFDADVELLFPLCRECRDRQLVRPLLCKPIFEIVPGIRAALRSAAEPQC